MSGKHTPPGAAVPAPTGAQRGGLSRHERGMIAFWIRAGVMFLALLAGVSLVSVGFGYASVRFGFGAPQTSGPVTGDLALLTLLLVAGLVAFGAGLWLTVAWWKRVDEAVRRAHLVGFFFGGTVGLCLAALLGSALIGAQPLAVIELERVFLSETEAFGWGALSAVTVVLVAYLAGWAVWWLRIQSRP
jgi:hypothetical protein